MDTPGPAAASAAGRTPGALLALTFTTGVVDATTFLALGGVFAAMMTGNVVFLGLGLSGGAGASVTGPLVAIVAFLGTGAVAAALARRGEPPAFGTPLSNAVEVVLLAAAACVAAATTLDPDGPSGYATLALLAAAMSWRTTNVRALGSVNVPTAVLNLTLIAGPVAHGPGIAGGDDLRPRALALAAFLAGAVAGGLLQKLDTWVPLALAALLALAVAAVLRGRGPTAAGPVGAVTRGGTAART